jgi:RHS repeat-associated protein
VHHTNLRPRGSLVAIQNNGETPELQLTNLHGDIITKAYLSETATGLASKADTSEFGVPTVTAPAKYSWLGASELPTELPSGVITMGVRSYVPQIGRFLQPDPVPGGSADAYSYTFGDPVNTSDPTGDYTNTASAATLREMELEGQELSTRDKAIAEYARVLEREADEKFVAQRAAEKYAAEQAARATEEAAAEAAAAAGPQYEEEEWEEWWEEEGQYEYISDHPRAEGHIEEGHSESGIFYQLPGEIGGNREIPSPGSNHEGARSSSATPLCGHSSRPGGCAVFTRGGEGTVYRGKRPKYRNVGSGNACVGLGTTAAYVSPFAPELAGVLVGIFLAARC